MAYFAVFHVFVSFEFQLLCRNFFPKLVSSISLFVSFCFHLNKKTQNQKTYFFPIVAFSWKEEK